MADVDPRPDPNADYWTMADIAQYLGVKLRTVHTYRLRGKELRQREEQGEAIGQQERATGLPVEDKMMGRTPVWKPQTIVSWPRPGQGAGGGRPRKSGG